MEAKIHFQKDAAILTANGQEVGSLERVVFSPASKMVTHIVVSTGSLLNKVEKVLPIDLVAQSTEDKVTLRDEVEDLESFHPFEEQRVVDKKAGLDLPSTSGSTTPELIGYPEPDIPYIPAPGEQYVTQTGRNIPQGTVALKEGAKVMSADEKDVGRVERVLADPGMQHVTHLLISKGMFPQETKLIPMGWVTTMTDDEVYLQVDEHSVEELTDVSIAR